MRVDNLFARDYYTREAADQNWSTRQLERNIHSFYYERLLMSPDKKAMLMEETGADKPHPAEFIKDPNSGSSCNSSKSTMIFVKNGHPHAQLNRHQPPHWDECQ